MAALGAGRGVAGVVLRDGLIVRGLLAVLAVAFERGRAGVLGIDESHYARREGEWVLREADESYKQRQIRAQVYALRGGRL